MESYKSLKILIVDDNAENLFALSAVLKREGYTITTANSGEQALKLLTKEKFGIILLDVRMPVMDGFELASKIKEMPSLEDIPIIFLSAESGELEHKIQGYKVGALDYLMKPLNSEILLLKVKNLLIFYQTQKELEAANSKLEKVAKASELSFENLFYASPDEIIILDQNGFIKRINRVSKLSMGFEPSDLVGRHFTKLPFKYEIKDTKNPNDLFNNVMDYGIKGDVVEAKIRDADGNIRYYELVGSIFHTVELERFLQLSLRDNTKKIEIQTALAKSETKYKTVVEDLTEIIVRWDFINGITFFNKAVANFLELNKNNILGRSWEAYVHPEDLFKIKELISTINKNNKFVTVESRVITAKGNLKYSVFRIHGLFDKRGHLTEYQSVGRDITEQKQFESKLKWSNERLDEAQKVAKMGYWEADLVNKNLVWSEGIYNLFNIKSDAVKLSFQTYYDYCHPDDLDYVYEELNASRQQHGPYSFVHRIKLQDGEVKYIEVRCETQTNSEGIAVKQLGTIQDITERKISEINLENSEERFQLAMEGASDGLWDYDVISGKRYFSPKWMSMIGYEPNELEVNNDTWKNLLHPDDRERAVTYVNSFIDGTTDYYSQEFRMQHKKGHYVNILSRAISLKNQDGKVYRLVGTHVDITERVKFLNKLRENESFINGILNSMSSQIVVVDEKGKILITNNYYSELKDKINVISIDPKENYFEICQNLANKGDKLISKFLNGVHNVLSEKNDRFHIEYPIQVKGVTQWFLITVTPYWDKSRKVVITYKDITDRKKTLDKIKFDSQILAGISEAVIYSDLDLNVVEWNQNASEMFGWEKEEISGKNYTEELEFVYLDNMNFDNLIIKLIKEDKCKLKVEATTKGNKKIYASLNSSLVKNSDGIPTGIVSILEDISEKMMHERALAISELNYKELFQQSPFGILTLDIEGSILTANDKLLELTGYNSTEFIGKHLSSSPIKIMPSNIQLESFLDLVLKSNKGSYAYETSCFTRSGDEIFLDVDAKFIFAINKISLIVRDITSVKKSEKFNLMLFNIAAFTNSTSINCTSFGTYLQNELIKYFSTDYLSISSYNSKFNELEFLYYNDINSRTEQAPPPRRNVNGLTELVIKTKEPIFLQPDSIKEFLNDHHITIVSDKVVSWMGAPLIANSVSVGAIAVQSYSKPFTKSDFEILKLISSFIAPIVEKLKNDQKLLLINTAVSSAGEAVFITNPKLEGNPVVFINKEFTEISGYNAEEIYESGIEALVGQRTGKFAKDKLRNAFINKSSYQGEILLYKKDGSTFWSDLSIDPVKDENGETINFIGIQNDITVKKEMERLLIEKNKELELFMYRSSHDLKGPLSTSKGLLRFALDECKDPNISHYLQLIEKSNNKLDNVLSELMEIVIIREGTSITSEVDLEKLINELVDSYIELDDTVSTKINFIKEFILPEKIETDSKLLKIVLRNIFNNAVKYSNKLEENSFVKISAFKNGTGTVIQVQDNGIGILPNHINKVFDMFYRATDSSTGTGLGLYITKNAVEKLGGTIHVESEEKKGTIVTVNLPK